MKAAHVRLYFTAKHYWLELLYRWLSPLKSWQAHLKRNENLPYFWQDLDMTRPPF